MRFECRYRAKFTSDDETNREIACCSGEEYAATVTSLVETPTNAAPSVASAGTTATGSVRSIASAVTTVTNGARITTCAAKTIANGAGNATRFIKLSEASQQTVGSKGLFSSRSAERSRRTERRTPHPASRNQRAGKCPARREAGHLLPALARQRTGRQ